MSNKQYLGDGLYVDFNGVAIVLTAENGIRATDTVYLEPAVFQALLDYRKKYKIWAQSEPEWESSAKTTHDPF